MNQELKETLVKLNYDYVEEDNGFIRIKANDNFVEKLSELYDLENTFKEENFGVDFKGCSTETIIEAIKYSLSREDLRDMIMILNILNLIKTYNTLDNSFFDNSDVYVSSIEELLDIKLSIKPELNAFIKQLSIYFISLFKSYNKVSYTPMDVHIDLPNLYASIVLSSDFLTLSGILSVSESFSLSDCVYINDAYKYISSLLLKNVVCTSLFSDFLESNNGNSI